MAEQNISYLLKEQNNFFHSGSTLPVSNRQKALKNCSHVSECMRRIFNERFSWIWEKADSSHICVKQD